MLARKLMGGAGAEETLYVDDVFSTYLYTGNGSTQTVTNGIDLAGEGGLVWIKPRTSASNTNHILVDTVRGISKWLYTDGTGAEASSYTGSFLSDGFTTSSVRTNENTYPYVSWTFRKAPKFFDVQTATLGTGNATVSFSGLSTLGMVIVKRTDSTGDWYVWHRSLTAGKLMYLNQIAAEATLGHITVSGTTLTLVDGTLADGNYVCYAFAHDTATDGIIQCGSFTGNAVTTLGWEPQYIMYKRTDSTGNWIVVDSMRGIPTGTSDQELYPNLSNAETASAADYVTLNATGFTTTNLTGTYIYLAIRRPNKPPTSGTEVYNNSTPSSPSTTYTDAGFSPDMVMGRERAAIITGSFAVYDRLRGIGTSSRRLRTTSDTTEDAWDGITQIGMLGVTRGVDTSMGNGSGILHYFRRAVGFFDEVCFTGAASGDQAISHSLGVAPEWIIICSRTSTAAWYTYTGNVNAYLTISSSDSLQYFTGMWPSTANTSSVFNIKPANVGVASKTAVAYLFATLAGISKVGSYTGNGSSQTINCGFSAGARFILIKRTDTTGDWYVWDSVRGIVAANDPHLSLNTTAAEVTTDDSVDPDNSGFIVNQVAATNINVNTASYIFLAIA